jgi:SAM-dependent methyltransferase
MSDAWDREWAGKTGATAMCATNPNWGIIRRHLRPPARVLEAGCGLGQWVKFLHDEGFEAHGIDLSPLGIEKSRRMWPELENRLRVGDLRSLPYADGFFDAIVSFGAVEHNEEGVEGPLREMLRVLKPGGLLYCTVPCMNRLRRLGLMALKDWIVCNPTIRRLTGRSREVAFFEYVFYRDEYEKILRRVGFDLLALHPLEPMTMFCGGYGTLRYKIIERLHPLSPWTLAHMMAAVCRRPAS